MGHDRLEPGKLATTDMETFQADVAIIGAGGAGLRAAIAVAEANPALRVALVSKVYPMRSHTVAAEGGAAAVTQAHDSLEDHFHAVSYTHLTLPTICSV